MGQRKEGSACLPFIFLLQGIMGTVLINHRQWSCDVGLPGNREAGEAKKLRGGSGGGRRGCLSISSVSLLSQASNMSPFDRDVFTHGHKGFLHVETFRGQMS